MRIEELLTEALIRRKLGNLILRVSDHVQDRAQERGIPWSYVTRMLDMAVSPEMAPKLESVLGKQKFRLRDNELWVDLGCVYTPNGDNTNTLFVNTVMREEPGARNLYMPIVELN